MAHGLLSILEWEPESVSIGKNEKVAFDLEWEPESVSIGKNIIQHPYVQELTSATSERPEYQRISTFAYEDSYGNTKVLDVTDFASCQNPQQEFLLAIRNTTTLLPGVLKLSNIKMKKQLIWKGYAAT